MKIYEEYFEWIYQYVSGKGKRKVLEHIHSKQFIPILPLDDNRIYDGCGLRSIFGDDCNIPQTVIHIKFKNEQVSILEVMLGLSIRTETSMMCDLDYGDRTVMWFWLMMKSLGLYDMTDDKYNEDVVDNILKRFINREYEPNGRGGLFTVKNTDMDLREMEIWRQMCLFFDNLL